MRHSAGLAAAAVSAVVLVACGGGNKAAETTTGATNHGDNPLLNSDARPQPISTSGCLTASNGRYVLTSLDTSATVPTTVTYQLVGGNDADLQKQVNREVRVAGEADQAKVADIRDIGTPAATTGNADAGTERGTSTDRPQPEVKTQQAMRFEVRTLKVTSVTPTGDECPAGPDDQAPPR